MYVIHILCIYMGHVAYLHGTCGCRPVRFEFCWKRSASHCQKWHIHRHFRYKRSQVTILQRLSWQIMLMNDAHRYRSVQTLNSSGWIQSLGDSFRRCTTATAESESVNYNALLAGQSTRCSHQRMMEEWSLLFVWRAKEFFGIMARYPLTYWYTLIFRFAHQQDTLGISICLYIVHDWLLTSCSCTLASSFGVKV